MARLPCAPLRHVPGYLFAQAKLGIYSGEPGEPAVAGELTAVEGDLERELRRMRSSRSATLVADQNQQAHTLTGTLRVRPILLLGQHGRVSERPVARTLGSDGTSASSLSSGK